MKALVLKGHKVVLVGKVETDVVVIAISCFSELSQFGLEKLWMEFGIGISKIWIPLHDVISFLRIKVLDFCFGILLPALMQLRRLEVKENYQRGQLGWCSTISRQSLKNTYITVDTFKSKKNYKFETLEFWKDSLAYFTVEQQYSNV